MALLHKAAACVIPLLLCLCFRDTAPHALQQHPNGQGIGGEVRSSLEGETGSSGQGAVGLQLTATTQGAASDAPITGDSSTMPEEQQNDGLNEEPTWKGNGQRDSLEAHINLKENMTQETEGESGDGKGDARAAEDSEDDKEGKEEKVIQGVIQSSGWFTDTLDVTSRPVVTWSRRAAPRRPPPLTKDESREEGDEEEEEEEEEEEGRRREDDEDVLLTVKFIKEGHQLILDLHPTRDLLAASYKESSRDTSGDDTLPGETRAMPCEYQGVVRDEEGTWVALSVCGGLSGVVAVTLKGGEEVELLVEPLPGSTSPHQPHRVFSSTLLNLPERTCGVKDTNTTTEVKDDPRNAYTTDDDERMTNASFSPLRRVRRWVGLVGEALWFEKNTRFVELVLVADRSYYIAHGAQTRSRCKALVNIVNAVYRPLGVVVVLSHLEVWKYRDKIPVTADYAQNLELFKGYRRKMLEKESDYNNDNTMLLTAVDFTGTTVGYATVSGMCGLEGSVGVVQDKQDHVGVVAYTLTHEMGHNFGMNHDQDRKNERECHCPTSSCVMSSVNSATFKPHISWSSCSKRVIENRIDSESYDCLKNVPMRMYPNSNCGDGVVDDDEQCDCGPEEFCDNPCCVAATCRFAVNASCASGPCCDTKKCQFKPPGVVCREAFTECDLPEFCSGNSESCPEDVTKADGIPCRKGQGYCYKARCGSHEGRCHAVWGWSATVADPVCYSKLNKRGGTNGNCGFKGHTKTALLPCADGDQLCGSLHCLTVPDSKPQLKISINYGTFTFAHYKCSYIVSNDKVQPWRWLTPNGARCADGKMCLNQKCVQVPKPAGHCRGGCSGHGVCNSRNHCHCDPGFAPPDCSKEGLGGSIDSFRIGRDRYKDPLWEAVFILSLIALGAASALCCLWSHVRRWWEARGRASTRPCCARCLDACCCPLMSLITDSLCTKKKKEDLSKEAQDVWEKDKIMCQVDLDLKDNKSQTNSWGVANERLVTEVVTMTPKISPDFRRKIQLPSNHSAHQPKMVENLDRPTYMQSVSVDSGCISDVEETTVEEHYNSRMSMKSLVSVFKKFGTRSSPSPGEKESSPPKTYERQRSMPLRRFVVDPLAGSRRSRHGTPPPEQMKPEWRRSVSFDVQSTATSRPNGAPPPAPSPIRPAPPPAHSPQLRKPMMPPGKKQTSVSIKTQSKNEFPAKSVSPGNAIQQKDKGPKNTPQKRPLLPPVKGPERSPAAMLPKTSAGSSKPRTPRDVPPPSTAGGRVKELAKKLEKQ